MSAFFEWMSYGLIAFGVLVFVAMFVGKGLKAMSRQVVQVIDDALDTEWADERSPDPREDDGRPAVRPAPAVVASDDLTWQVDLAKFYRDYDTYRTELRLPGEGR